MIVNNGQAEFFDEDMGQLEYFPSDSLKYPLPSSAHHPGPLELYWNAAFELDPALEPNYHENRCDLDGRKGVDEDAAPAQDVLVERRRRGPRMRRRGRRGAAARELKSQAEFFGAEECGEEAEREA
ncbi:hypothetical protein B0H14DRAFT_2604254 [Mycena olivaceomarginata]|nr:hypothetical protein B0H14DRAFT_2604254 [Mycena olivaceomarginata]